MPVDIVAEVPLTGLSFMQARNPEGFKTGETTSRFFVIEPAGAIVFQKGGLWRAPYADDGSIAVDKGEALAQPREMKAIVATTDRLICDAQARGGKNNQIAPQLQLCDRQAAVLATAELPAALVPQGLAVAGDRIAAACVDGSIVLLSTR
jgi:hypothetical protein